MKRNLVLLALLGQVGCTIVLPFNHRVATTHLERTGALEARSKGPVTIKWNPADFPERVDVQGASGFVGGGSRTRIPTGVALASRITELMEKSLGLSQTATKTVNIKIIKAESKFQYSAGFFNITPAMDRGVCNLEVEITVSGEKWTQTFTSEKKDEKVGGSTTTGILEAAWDDVAIQLVAAVVKKL